MVSSARRSDWPAYRAILAQPLLQRRALGSLWMSWMLIAMLLAFSALAVAKSNKILFVIGVGLPLGMLILMWWVLYFGSILAQFNPIAVQLAPRMRERALRITVAVWAVMVLSMTLVVGLPTGYPGQVAVATGLALMEMTVMLKFWRLATLGVGNWLLLHSGPAVADWYVAFLGSSAAVALGLLLIFLDGRLALRRMFYTPRRLSSSTVPETIIPPVISRLARIFQRIGGDTSRGQPLIMRMLGPSAFAGGRLYLVLVATACLAARGWLALRGGVAPHEELFVTRVVLLALLLGMQGLMTLGEMANGYKRGVEQALVRLAPGAPAASGLNRFLARNRLLRFMRMWTWASALALGALVVLGASWSEVWRAAIVCSFTLGLAGVPLRDYARHKVSQPLATAIAVVFEMATAIGVFAALRGEGAPSVWACCALASFAFAAWFAWRRWAGIVRAAPAFPAGRNC